MADDPNRIRALRLEREWSQQRLADLVRCSKVQISDLERGNVALTVDWMRRIAVAMSQFGRTVTPGELLSEADNPLLPAGGARDLLERYNQATSEEREQLRRVADALVDYRPQPKDEDARWIAAGGGRPRS